MTGTPTTTRRRWALPALGGLACAACCALPLLLAAGVIGAGTAATLDTWLDTWVPAAAVVLVTASVLLLALRSRRRRAHTSGCGGPDGCSCSPPAGEPERALPEPRVRS
jgi:mercuric ion transport protein